MEKNYIDKAVNWWTEAIKKKNNNLPVIGLDLFQEELASKIKSCISINAGIRISTFDSRSNILDAIAYHANLDARIPAGYEMRILLNNVMVYDSIGKLVERF